VGATPDATSCGATLRPVAIRIAAVRVGGRE
jgi:hypothetical protein